MKNIKRALILFMSWHMMISPVMAKQEEKASEVQKIAPKQLFLHLLKKELTDTPEKYLGEYDLDHESKVEDSDAALEANLEFVQMIDDTSIPLSETRKLLVQKIREEESLQKVEFEQILLKVDMEKAEELFELALRDGKYSQDFRMEFDTAYTNAEKKRVLASLLFQDLTQIKSDLIKRVGRLGRIELRKELETAQSILNEGRFLKGKDWKIILVTILSVAAAGFVSWAIISATKKRYDRKLEKERKKFEELHADLPGEYSDLTTDANQFHADELQRMIDEHSDRMSQAEIDHANRVIDLQNAFSTRASLRDQGYVWSICNVQERTVTQTCPYNLNTYTGVERCVSHCMKNPSTGDTLGQTDLICANASIPMNCNIPNAYNTGNANGEVEGYLDGYDIAYRDAYDDAYTRAYNDYYSRGYDDGKPRGYDDGYNDGYSDGLSEGEYESDRSYEDGYSEGYSVGYNYAIDTLFGF
jgi:hypothetical protein